MPDTVTDKLSCSDTSFFHSGEKILQRQQYNAYLFNYRGCQQTFGKQMYCYDDVMITVCDGTSHIWHGIRVYFQTDKTYKQNTFPEPISVV